MIDNIAEPPYDTNGSGIPTTGISPMTIDILSAPAIKKFDINDIPSILEKKLFSILFQIKYTVKHIFLSNRL